MNKIYFLLTIVFILCANVFAEENYRFIMPVHEEGQYRTVLKKTGKEIWRAKWTLDKDEAADSDNFSYRKESIRIKEKGKGYYDNAKEKTSWEVESTIFLKKYPCVISTIRKAFSLDNKEIWRKNKIFNYDEKELIAEYFKDGRLIERKSVPLIEGVVLTSEILSLVLRGYNFETTKPFGFYIFSSLGKLFKMKAQKVAQEMVQVPAGEFECYKIEIFPSFGIVDYLSKHIFPKTYLWITVKEPHFWVKYEGLESGFTSPHVVMEITEFKGIKKEQ